MSYVRTAEGTSDVYVYGSGDAFHVIIAWRVAHFNSLPQSHRIPYRKGKKNRGRDVAEVVGYLMYLRHQGVKVPDFAFTRLYAEMDRPVEREYDKEYEARRARDHQPPGTPKAGTQGAA